MPEGRTKVAVLGGGVGAMAAAFYLTDGPNAGKYDVTVYQIGWRLGGKGASGRNASVCHRIEEHGLHVWFGFYYNALPLMRRCYAELGDPGDTFEHAFTPHDYAVLEDRVDGRWEHLPLDFPRAAAGGVPTPLDYVRRILAWLRQKALDTAPLALPRAPEHPPEPWAVRARAALAALGHALDPRHPLDLIHDAFTLAHAPAAETPSGRDTLHGRLPALVDAFRTAVRARLDHALGDDTLRRLWMTIDLGAAVARGLVADRVVWRGFDVIDGDDVWQWLVKHGAAAEHENSVFVRTLYSQAFAFPGGKPATRGIAAGVALRATLRMLFGYHGAVMWKMNAGMGDTIFAPLYRLLVRRGVRFEFFSRVRELHLATDANRIGRITIGRQLRVKERRYRPLIRVLDPRVGTRFAWPGEPDWDQIDDDQVREIRRLQSDPNAYVDLESHWSSWGPAHEEERVLEDGRDFDAVILGVSIGALPQICRQLVRQRPAWVNMLARVKTVRTQAFQLWLRPALADLGWTLQSPVATAYVEPLDTWADMNQTRPAEPWPAGREPGLIAYFCGVMPDAEHEPAWFTDPAFPRAARRAAYENMKAFLREHVRHLWPRATSPEAPDTLDWTLLVAPPSAADEERLRAQFWVANVEPTERYVLSVPGSTEARLWSDASGVDNLFLAGDWTRNAINAGCVEAAVTSAMRAAQGISGHPADIVGEDR